MFSEGLLSQHWCSAGLPLIQFQSRSRKSEERETHKVWLPQPPPYHLYSSSHTLFFLYSACSPGIWWCWPLAEQSAHGASIFTATFIWNWLWLLFCFGLGWIDLLLATIPEIAFSGWWPGSPWQHWWLLLTWRPWRPCSSDDHDDPGDHDVRGDLVSCPTRWQKYCTAW